MSTGNRSLVDLFAVWAGLRVAPGTAAKMTQQVTKYVPNIMSALTATELPANWSHVFVSAANREIKKHYPDAKHIMNDRLDTSVVADRQVGGDSMSVVSLDLIYQNANSLVRLGHLLALGVSSLEKRSRVMSSRARQYEHVLMFRHMLNPAQSIRFRATMIAGLCRVADPRLEFMFEPKYLLNPSPGSLLLLFCQFFVLPVPHSSYTRATVALVEVDTEERIILGPIGHQLEKTLDRVELVAEWLRHERPADLSAGGGGDRAAQQSRLQILLFIRTARKSGEPRHIRAFVVYRGGRPVLIEEEGAPSLLYAYFRCLEYSLHLFRNTKKQQPRASSKKFVAEFQHKYSLTGLSYMTGTFLGYRRWRTGEKEQVRTMRTSELLRGLFPEWSPDACARAAESNNIKLAYLFGRHACRHGLCASNTSRPVSSHSQVARDLLMRDGQNLQRALFTSKDKHYTIRQDLLDIDSTVQFVHGRLLHPSESCFHNGTRMEPVYTHTHDWGRRLQQCASRWLSEFTEEQSDPPLVEHLPSPS